MPQNATANPRYIIDRLTTETNFYTVGMDGVFIREKSAEGFGRSIDGRGCEGVT